MSKRLLILALVVCLVISLGIFQTFASNKRIGVSIIAAAVEFCSELGQGAREAAEKDGVHVHYHDADFDISSQFNALENFIALGVDAIIVQGVDPLAIVPVIEEAYDRGIPVISTDMRLQTEKVSTFVGSDNFTIGERLGEVAKNYVEEEIADAAKVAIVMWPASVAQIERMEGFRSVIDPMPNANVVMVSGIADTREAAMRATEDIITSVPDIDIIVGLGEPSTVGVVAGIEGSGHDAIALGTDWALDSVRALRDGTILKALVAQQPRLIGKICYEAAMDALAGKELDETIFVPVEVVTPETVDDFGG